MVARTPSTVFYTGVIRFSDRIGHHRSPSPLSYLKKKLTVGKTVTRTDQAMYGLKMVLSDGKLMLCLISSSKIVPRTPHHLT